FFFSSRRRHTRSYGDWSSDVCSSDLRGRHSTVVTAGAIRTTSGGPFHDALEATGKVSPAYRRAPRQPRPAVRSPSGRQRTSVREIGRASCRERVWIWVVGGGWKRSIG